MLGLILLNALRTPFEERRATLQAQLAADDVTGEAAEELRESRGEYTAEGVFCVPPEARQQYLKEWATQPEIGKLIDNASPRGVRPKLTPGPAMMSADSASSSTSSPASTSAPSSTARISLAGSTSTSSVGGELYTPRSVVKLVVEMIEPLTGRVYDGCCGQRRHVRSADGGIRRFVEVDLVECIVASPGQLYE